MCVCFPSVRMTKQIGRRITVHFKNETAILMHGLYPCFKFCCLHRVFYNYDIINALSGLV